MTEQIFTVDLDRPRRMRLTEDSAARAEEELGDLLEFMKQGRSDNEYVADVFWALSLADDPELSRLEAQKIIQTTIMRAPRFIALKRARALKEITTEALKAFWLEVFGGLATTEEK